MGMFRLLPEFLLFDSRRGHSRSLSKFGENNFMCTCTLQPQVADAVCSSHYHFGHFILIQFDLSWLGDVSFENGLVSGAYMLFVEACKQDCGWQK